MPEPSDLTPTPHEKPSSAMFAEPAPARSFPTMAVAIAGAAIVILAAALLLLNHRGGVPSTANKVLPQAVYAPSLAISDVQMSESTSLSGGKSTYIDGHIANHGPSTVTAIGLQVLFANDQAMPPQIENTPLRLIRIRDPEIDTQAVSAAPLGPGGEADFRLIFEDINANWNGQPPEIHVTQVSTR